MKDTPLYFVSIIDAFIIGVLFGNLAGKWIFENSYKHQEIGMCVVSKTPEIFCINGELMVENPNYIGKTLVSDTPKFVRITRGIKAYCSCSDKTSHIEDAIILGDLKESVNIEKEMNASN